jgi:hypothetical protein
MGSLYMLQSILRPIIRYVQMPYERMDCVQAGGLLQRVPLEAASPYMCQRGVPDTGCVDGRGKKGTLPPSPSR